MPGQHARLGPSGADRWMLCPGSVDAEAVEPNESNEWAAEGTVAHWVFEQCLRHDLEPFHFVGRTRRVIEEDGKVFDIKIDDDMCEHLQPIIDEVRDMGGDQHYELKLDLSRWMPEQFGTLDVGIILREQNLIVIRDLKYGAGLPVFPEKNRQLRIYALGFWDNVARKFWKTGEEKPRIRIVIDQPRNHGGGGVWECSFDELLDFGDEVEDAAEATNDPNAPRIPGEKQCGYCRSAMNLHCREYEKWVAAQVDLKLKDFTEETTDADIEAKLPDPEKISPEKRAAILKVAPVIRQFLNRIHADCIADALQGRPTGGLKAVVSRKGIRKWRDEEAGLEWLEANIPESKSIYKPREIVSPAGAEKLLGTKIVTVAPTKKGRGKAPVVCFDIVQDEGKPTLVPDSDPRPPMKAYHENFRDFGDADE